MLGWGSLRAESRWRLVPCPSTAQVLVGHLTTAPCPALNLAPWRRAFCLWGAPSLTGETGTAPTRQTQVPRPLGSLRDDEEMAWGRGEVSGKLRGAAASELGQKDGGESDRRNR